MDWNQIRLSCFLCLKLYSTLVFRQLIFAFLISIFIVCDDIFYLVFYFNLHALRCRWMTSNNILVFILSCLLQLRYFSNIIRLSCLTVLRCTISTTLNIFQRNQISMFLLLVCFLLEFNFLLLIQFFLSETKCFGGSILIVLCCCWQD